MTIGTGLLCIKEEKNYSCCEVEGFWLLHFSDPKDRKFLRKQVSNYLIPRWHNDDRETRKIQYDFKSLLKLKSKYDFIGLLTKQGTVRIIKGNKWRTYFK